jgi:hypothetical protein
MGLGYGWSLSRLGRIWHLLILVGGSGSGIADCCPLYGYHLLFTAASLFRHFCEPQLG